MATTAAILSVLVEADTAAATANLTKYDKQLAAVNDTAKKGISVQLGAEVDQAGFKEYEDRLARTARIAKDRQAFKAELGANFNNAGFLAYERSIDKAKREAAAGVAVNVKIADAVARLNELQVRIGAIPDKIDTKVEVDTGVATAKLDLLQRKIRDVERDAARADIGGGAGGFLSLLTGGGGGGGGGGGAGSIAGLLPGGGTAPVAGGLLAGLAPLIGAGLGSATAVAGSAGAAALGAGALGTAGLGAGAAGIGPLLALSGGLSDAVKLSGALFTAQQKLAAVTKVYGEGSTQAKTAQNELNVAMAGAAPATLSFAKQLAGIHAQLNAGEQKILPDFVKALKPVLGLFGDLFPTVERMAHIDLAGVSKGLAPLLSVLKSADFKSSLITLAQTFAKLAVPIGAAAANLLTAFMHVAVAASPYLVQIANAFERWTKSFAATLVPGAKLEGLIAGLVGQLSSWFKLATSVGGLMLTIFKAGAGTGQGLVNMLTNLVRQWNAWLNTKSGQAALQTFFTNSAKLVTALFRALGPLLGAMGKLIIGLMPAFTALITALTPAMRALAGVVSLVANALSSKLFVAIVSAVAKFNPTILVISHLKDILGALGDAAMALRGVWNTVWNALRTTFDKVAQFVLGGISKLLGAMADMADAAHVHISFMGVTFDNGMGKVGDALKGAKSNVDKLRASFEPTADAAKTQTGRIAGAHEDMRNRVEKAVGDMASAVSTGIGKVDSALHVELKSLGVTVGSVVGTAGQQAGGAISGVGNRVGKAGGGLLQIGRAGAAGRDTVPLNVGGTPIAVGAGEQVAVFNRHQLPIVNAALAGMGGLPGLFSQVNRPNYMTTGGYVYPIGPGAVDARIDQGKDFTGGPFNVGAIGPGEVLRDTLWPGWPGTGGVVYKLTAGPKAGANVYQMEHQVARVRTGQKVGPGQIVTTSMPGYPWLEIGWANQSATGPASPYNGLPDGTPTAGGKDFAAFIAGLAHGQLVGGAGAGAFGGLGAAAMWKNITAPKVTGRGVLGTITNAAVGLVAKAANAFGEAHAGIGTAGGVGLISGGGGSVARQIANILAARGFNKMGIAGVLGNAYGESGYNPASVGSGGGGLWGFTAPPVSLGDLQSFAAAEHQPWTSVAVQTQFLLDHLPPGLIGAVNSASSPAAASDAFMNLFEKPGVPRSAVREGAAQQAFAAGLTRGGLVSKAQGFAKGGFAGHLNAGKWKPIKIPKLKLPFKIPRPLSVGEPAINKTISSIGGILDPQRGQVATLADLIGFTGQQYDQIDSEYVTAHPGLDPTTGLQAGATVNGVQGPAVEDVAFVNMRIAQLSQLVQWQATIKAALERAAMMIGRVVQRIQAAIQKRRQQIESIRETISANLSTINSLTATIAHTKGGKLATIGLRGRRTALQNQNRQLGGAANKIGTGGILGTLTGQVTSLQGMLGTVSDDQLQIIGASGVGGDLGTAKLGLQTFADELKVFSPGSVQTALSAANAANATGPTDAPVTDAATIQMLQQLLDQAHLATSVSQQQLSILQTTPPFGGSFAQGGMVPGPIGMPRTIIAHGGETVTPTDSGQVRVVIEDHRTRVFYDDVEQIVNQVTRGDSVRASRPLPGHKARF